MSTNLILDYLRDRIREVCLNYSHTCLHSPSLATYEDKIEESTNAIIRDLLLVITPEKLVRKIQKYLPKINLVGEYTLYDIFHCLSDKSLEIDTIKFITLSNCYIGWLDLWKIFTSMSLCKTLKYNVDANYLKRTYSLINSLPVYKPIALFTSLGIEKGIVDITRCILAQCGNEIACHFHTCIVLISGEIALNYKEYIKQRTYGDIIYSDEESIVNLEEGKSAEYCCLSKYLSIDQARVLKYDESYLRSYGIN